MDIDGDSLAAQPGIGEDAIRALGRLPGLAQNGISAQSSIRGGESGELLTLLDGFPLRQAFHIPGYQSVFGVLDPGLIDEAEVYTGGFPVRYGNRMGGVFDLSTIDATQEPRTALGLSVFNAMARSGGNLEIANVDWLAAARVGTLSPLIDALARDAGRPTYSDVYARAGARGMSYSSTISRNCGRPSNRSRRRRSTISSRATGERKPAAWCGSSSIACRLLTAMRSSGSTSKASRSKSSASGSASARPRPSRCWRGRALRFGKHWKKYSARKPPTSLRASRREDLP
jgi:hypothetical protein